MRHPADAASQRMERSHAAPVACRFVPSFDEAMALFDRAVALGRTSCMPWHACVHGHETHDMSACDSNSSERRMH